MYGVQDGTMIDCPCIQWPFLFLKSIDVQKLRIIRISYRLECSGRICDDDGYRLKKKCGTLCAGQTRNVLKDV